MFPPTGSLQFSEVALKMPHLTLRESFSLKERHRPLNLCGYTTRRVTSNIFLKLREAKKRGLTCGVKVSEADLLKPKDLKQLFIAQPKLRRQQLQYALKKLGYYSYGTDGLWGKGTSSGFDKFVSSNKLQGKAGAQVFSSLLSKVNVPTSFKPDTIRVATNWSFDINCSGQKTLGRASFSDRKVVAGKAQYRLFCENDRGGRYQGLVEFADEKFQFRMKVIGRNISATGSGSLNSSYTRAKGTTSDNCSFVAFTGER